MNLEKDEPDDNQLEDQMEQDKAIDDTKTKTNTETKAEPLQEYKNYKEKLYDKIPISLKALDFIITILIAIFVIMMVYFIIRRF